MGQLHNTVTSKGTVTANAGMTVSVTDQGDIVDTPPNYYVDVGTSVGNAATETVVTDEDYVPFIDSSANKELNKISVASLKNSLGINNPGGTNYTHPNHTGDVISEGDGVTTIAEKAVTLNKVQDISNGVLLGRVTTGTGTAEQLSVTKVRELLSVPGASEIQESVNKVVILEGSARQQADRAASFVGGNWPLPHNHEIDALAEFETNFTRGSTAYLNNVLYGLNVPRGNSTSGWLIEEGTTNLLPAGAETFAKTIWTEYAGETITITDYPVYIAGLGDVIAKRITGNGAGTNVLKYYLGISALTNPHYSAISMYAQSLNSTVVKFGDYYGSSAKYTQIGTTMAKLSSIQTATMPYTTSRIDIFTANASDVIDIVLYQPQMEAKAYATSYTPPGTTRAAESAYINNNAYQKNLLSLNQATGGDALGDTTGFFADGSTQTRDTTPAYQGTGSIKYVTNNSAASEGGHVSYIGLTIGKIYTFSLFATNSGTINITKYDDGGANAITGDAVTLDATQKRVQVTFAATNTTALFYYKTNSKQVATFWVDAFQLEEGSVATYWTLPVADYSKAVLNPTAGTVEFEFTPTVSDKSSYCYLLWVQCGTKYIAVRTNITTGYFCLVSNHGAGTGVINSTVAPVAGIKNIHKFRFSSAGLKYYIDGNPIGTATYDTLLLDTASSIYIGASNSNTGHRNGYISYIRFSSIARTDAEMAYTRKLLADDYTTFIADYTKQTGNIGYAKVIDKNKNVQRLVHTGNIPELGVVTKDYMPNAASTYIKDCEAVFARASEAYDDYGRRFEYGRPCWDSLMGWRVMEGTTNLLPAGSENFTTGWTANTGATITVTPNQPDPWGGNTAYRIQSSGGTNVTGQKYDCTVSGRTNPHTDSVSCWVKVLSGNAKLGMASQNPVACSSSWARYATKSLDNYANTYTWLSFLTNAVSDSLDILVCRPQIEAKAYATTYTPPGTTRSAESLTIDNGAYQKNLLTLNQATGGDALSATTGFTAVLGSTIERDLTFAQQGTGSIKVTTANSASLEGVSLGTMSLEIGKIYTFSFNAKGTGVLSTLINPIYEDNNITLTSTSTRYSTTFAATTASPSIMIRTAGKQLAVFNIDSLQLEEGTTASDFTLPAVDYSRAVLNPTACSLVIDFIAPATGSTKYLFYAYSGNTNTGLLAYLDSSNVLKLQMGTGTGTETLSGVDALTPGTKYRFGTKLATKAELWVGGVKKATSTANQGLSGITTIYFGANNAGLYQLNSYISMICSSNIARTDAEMAYTGALVSDPYTTYYRDFRLSPDFGGTRPGTVNTDGTRSNFLTSSDRAEYLPVNGDFRLCSRGTLTNGVLTFTNPASTAKLLDGWAMNYNGSGATNIISQQTFTPGQQEVPDAEYYMRIVQSVAPTGQTTQYYIAKFENVSRFSGKRCILSIYLRSPEQIILPQIALYQNFGSGGSPSGDVTVLTATNVKTKTNMTKYVFQFTMPSVAGKTLGTAGNCLYLQVNHPINAAFTLDIAKVRLFEGSFDREIPAPSLPTEQDLMARYLQKIEAGTNVRMLSYTSTTMDFEIALPVEMRYIPTLVTGLAENTNFKLFGADGTTQVTGVTFSNVTAATDRKRSVIRATKSGGHGLTYGSLNFVTNALFSAEL